MVKVWDFLSSSLLFCHSGHKDGVKVTGLDWSRADTNRIVSVNDLGSIVVWDLASNTIRKLHSGVKALPMCLACCPHDKDIIAIGCKGGATLVVDIKGTGKLIHRLRIHELDIISMSWCPVPYNVIKHKRIFENAEEKKDGDVEKPQELLLAVGGLDKSIFIWRATSDGRYEVILNLPNNNMANSSGPRKKAFNSPNPNMLWTCVLWVDAYTLLSTSQYGELLSWDLNRVYSNDKSKKCQPRLLHSKHPKACFSIACPILYDEAVDIKADKRTVWTTAIDKHIVSCSLAMGNVLLDIPTIGGSVFCMAVSPLDPNRLAIGSSDSKVFVWNISDINALNMVAYWRKVIGKVMSLCWHPVEENWLAYGTSDGHVGLLDVGSYKVPTLFRLHHRKSVYRLCWAPPLLKPEGSSGRGNKLALFSVADGDVFQYTANIEEPEEEPKSLNAAVLNDIDKSQNLQKSLLRSEVVFKPDQSCFAIGSENGSVYILSCETLQLQHKVFAHKKLMNNLEWHPETVSSDNNVSPYKDWLATTCDNIKVYNIPPEGETPELVATLSGHSMKIVGLAWSPHFNGRLVSASYDCTVQVWDVLKQACLGTYMSLSVPVMSVLFSPLDPDVVITGSTDNTIRFLAVSHLPVLTSKPEKKKDRVEGTKRLRYGIEEATELVTDSEATISLPEKRSRMSSSPNSSQDHSIASDKSAEEFKRRQKNRSVFTLTSYQISDAQHFETLLQRYIKSKLPPAANSSPPPQPADNAETPSISDLGYLDFFGDEKAMHRLLMVEENQLEKSKNPAAYIPGLWQGNVSQMIKDAITKKKLNELLVSMAPMAGFDLWEQACETYASQLVESNEIVKASTYLLAINKVQEAVKLLIEYKMFPDAVAIAKCRLSANDPLITEAYTVWADVAKYHGNLILAAHCYLAANNTQACVETLARTKDLKSLKMAAILAKHIDKPDLADSLAIDCLTMCAVVSNHTVGQQLLEEMPQYQYWSVWLKAREMVARVKNRTKVEVFEWLEGRQLDAVPLLDTLTESCLPRGEVYKKLLTRLPTNKTPEYVRDMGFYVSGHLAAACAAKIEATPAHFLRHLVLAFSAAFHFQTSHPNSLALPNLLTLLMPKGLFSEDSILMVKCESEEEKQFIKSLKAFACASIINWMNSNWEKVKTLEQKETASEDSVGSDSAKKSNEFKMAWLPELISNCSGDVLDSESVLFFVKKAQKKQLEDVVAKENIQKKMLENQSKNHAVTKTKKNTVIKKTEDEENVDPSNKTEKVTKENGEVKKMDENLNLTADIKVAEVNTKQLKNANTTKSSEVKELDEQQTLNNLEKVESSCTIEAKSVQGKPVEVSKDSKKEINGETETNKTTSITNGTNEIPQLQSNGKENISKSDNNAAQVQEKENVDKLKSSNDMSKLNTAAQVAKKENSDSSKAIVNGNNATTNSCNVKEVLDVSLKVKEIKELDEALHKFEAERVSAPSPFTAYMNIKYLIENLVTKQDAKLAQTLQETCDLLWKKTPQ